MLTATATPPEEEPPQLDMVQTLSSSVTYTYDGESILRIAFREFELCSNSSRGTIIVENSILEFSPLNSVSCSFDFGLMYYVARWYDPCINMFTQPDTIIPDPGNSMDWNRYAYVNYNPINFSDPTGHYPGSPNPNYQIEGNDSITQKVNRYAK
ncbi:MAG: RHS repeat-associated core domain-containing protein, partial [Anaerolineae bacterium]|nr:RHS repeat-associated core domain-containing protein [Anaerolineae bacterium]